MVLAHLTDIHVADERDYSRPDELEWRSRARKHSEGLLARLLEDLAAQKPDHVVLTGDLTLSSKREEFERARAHLDAFLPSTRISVLPGNHNRWSAEASRWLEHSFANRMACDLGGGGFPYCHLAGNLAIVGLDSSPFEPTQPPADVKGFVGEPQLERLVSLGADPRVASRFVVVLLHHHLRLSDEDAVASDPKDPTPLSNAADVEQALSKIPVGLVLHGHRHKQMRLELPLGPKSVPVLCPGSATRVDLRPDRTGRYGLYDVESKSLRAARIRRYEASSNRFVWGGIDAGPAGR